MLYINAYMWNLEKMVQMNLLAVQEYTGRYTEQTCGHEGREKEGEMNWESTIDMDTLQCIKQIASGDLLYSTGSSAQCSVMT